MKRRYRAYSTYKDSGVEWLGKIPAHWDVRRLKFVSSIIYSNVDKRVKEDEIPVRQCNYVDVYKNDHIVNDLEFMEVTAKPEEIRKFLLRPGDIILTKDSEDWKDIAIPAFVPEPLDNVICGYHLALIRPSSPHIDPNYLFRSFQAAHINYHFQIEASGITRYGLGKRALGDALIVLPPLPEQGAIAAFLDRETARIDALIAHKRELIDLLRRQRTALISHAVTKGLNPTAPQKDSGVEWLGEIPAHWEVAPAIAYLKPIGKTVWPIATSTQQAFLYSIPSVQQSGNGELVDIEQIDSAKILIQEPCVLVSKLNPRKSTITIATPKPIVTLASVEFVALASKGACDLKFVEYLYRSESSRQYLDSTVNSATRSHQRTRPNVILKIKHGWPPLPEQRAIAAFLDRETARIDALIAKIEESIALLQQQRAALISAAVTGKIDVREQG